MTFARTRLAALLLPLAALLPAPASAMEGVVASIKPVHSLVAAVMEGVAEPGLIVSGAASPHSYSMRPSEAGLLEAASVVFWVGPGLETFLAEPLETLAGDAQVVALSQVDGLTRLAFREGGSFEAHDHEGEHENEDHDSGHAHEGHDHGAIDMHFWLDPENAKLFVEEIERTLAAADPANADAYAQNASATIERIDALSDEIAARLDGLGEENFVVFHDAYHYFEARFGLEAAAAITVNPEIAPGAARIAEIRDQIAARDAVCVFAEPQFEPSLVEVVIEGTGARRGTLDPLGAEIADGPDLWFELLETMAVSMEDCLRGEG